ncbi:hypothetical protein HVZ55_16130 [Escherichia fergusonii]|nr:hypothetical protein [Escherichia fergusonii]
MSRRKGRCCQRTADDKQRTIIMQWFMYGGGVLGLGFTVGLGYCRT